MNLKNLTPKSVFWHAVRMGLGLIFIYASIYKIGSPGAFAHQLFNYKILPSWAINPLAITMPWIQLSCGLLLLMNRWTRGASLLILIMMVTFQSALASALLRGLDVSCGCFESGGKSATWLTFFRDSFFLILAGLQTWKVNRGNH